MPICGKLKEVTFWLCLLVLLLAFVLWQANQITVVIGGLHDEGEYLMIGRLLYFGYRLYSEVFAVTPPLFLATMCWAFKVWGLSVQVARWLIVAYAVIGALAVALIARWVGGNLTGLFALSLLLMAPRFTLQSRTAMPDVPAASLAALSVLTAWLYLRSSKRLWLGLAGLIASASLLCKMVSLYIVPLLALVLISHQHDRYFSKPGLNPKALQGILLDWATLILSFALPFLICALVYDIRALYQQTIVFHLQSSAITPALISSNLGTIWRYLMHHNGHLSLLALCGVWWACTRWEQHPGLLVVVWAAILIAQFIVQTPLLYHHMLPLLLPLTILAGFAMSKTLQLFYGLVRGPERRRVLSLLVGFVLTMNYLLGLPGLLREVQKFVTYREEGIGVSESNEATELVKEISNEDDLIVTDWEIIAFQAGRNIPPILGGTSFKRIELGYLTSEQLIAITQEYNIPVIMFWSGRFRMLPQYLEWVKSNYKLAGWYATGHEIYIHPRLFPPRRHNLGDKILFLGYLIKDSELATEGKLKIHLHWRALRQMGEDYTIYLKLINDAYHIWGQQNSRPVWDGSPTNSWERGQIVEDKRELEVLPGTPPGLYRVEVILVDLHSGRTLELKEGGNLLLGPIEVPRREPPTLDELDIERSLKANLGNKVRLLGYNLESGLRPGDNIHLTLFWQCLEEMEQSYTVLIHLVDARDNIVAQKDNPPVDGFYLTTKWEAGEIVRDQYDLVIPSDVPSGEYRLKVGMYLAETGERLNVLKDGVPLPDNRILLQPVAIGSVE